MPQPKSFITLYTRFLMGNPRLLIGVFICLTAFFGYYLSRISIDASVESMIMKDDPVYQSLELSLEEFGSSEIQVILYEAPDVFAPEVLDMINRITARLKKIENVEEVLSLTNTADIYGNQGELSIKPLIEELPKTPEESARIRERAMHNPFFINNLFSADGTVTSINCEITPQNWVEDSLYFIRVVSEMREILAEEAPGERFRLAGVAVLGETSMRSVREDTRIFLTLTFLLIMITLFLVFRSAPGMYIPMSVVAVAAAWTMGFFSLMGKKLGPTTEMIPTLVMVYCLSDTIHLISRYFEESATGQTKEDALRTTLHHLLLACFMTSVTTACGLLTLTTSQLKPIKEFGFYAATGIWFAYFVSIIIPCIFYTYLRQPKAELQRQMETKSVGRLMKRIGDFNLRHVRFVLVLTVVVFAVSIWGIFRLRVETNVLEMLSRGGTLQEDYVFVDTRMAGVTPLQVVIRGEEQIAKDPRILRQVEKLEAYLHHLPEIGKVISLNDFLKQMNKVFHDGDPDYYRIPDDRNTIAQFIELFSLSGKEEAIGEVVNFDRTGLQVVGRLVNCHSSTRQYEIVRDLQRFNRENFDPELEVEVTGLVSIYAITVDYLINSLVKNIFLTFLIISVLLAFMVRSARIGALIMIPNVVPIILTLGLMGWTGISLNMATVTIAAIAMGIAVDDTIHFVARYRTELRKDQDHAAAMYRTLAGTGRAIIFTTLVITAGFVILVFSNFLPNVYFGSLMGFTMFGALLGDLIILPVLFLVFRPRFPKSFIDRLEKG